MRKKHVCQTTVVMETNSLRITRYVLFFYETDSTKREEPTTTYCDYKLNLSRNEVMDVNYIITYVKYQGYISEKNDVSLFFSG